MAEVVCEEYGLPLRPEAVPLFAQSGERRRGNVDKMVMKRVEALPHGLISSPEHFGADGGTFLEHVSKPLDRELASQQRSAVGL